MLETFSCIIWDLSGLDIPKSPALEKKTHCIRKWFKSYNFCSVFKMDINIIGAVLFSLGVFQLGTQILYGYLCVNFLSFWKEKWSW